MISSKTAPLAAHIINHDKTTLDVWDILFYLLKSCNPLLGGVDDDIITGITNLHIRHNEDIHSFFERVMMLQEKLTYSTEIVSKTKLLEKYVEAMSESKVHFHLLQYFIAQLNLHIVPYFRCSWNIMIIKND